MGTCFGCTSAATESNVMMIGLDGAGKTTVLQHLKKESVDETLPTLGFNVEQFAFDGLAMTLWDIGGQQRLRSVWKHYYGDVEAIIFVIDSNDRERIFGKHDKDDDCVKYWIDSLTTIPKLHKCIFLILANKQDQPDALTTNQIIDALDLCGKLRKRKWHIQPTVAVRNEGIDEAIAWLSSILQQKQKKTVL